MKTFRLGTDQCQKEGGGMQVNFVCVCVLCARRLHGARIISRRIHRRELCGARGARGIAVCVCVCAPRADSNGSIHRIEPSPSRMD